MISQHKHHIFLYLFRSLFLSAMFVAFSTQILTTVVRFIWRLLDFKAIINETLLILTSNTLLKVYRNTINICRLIFYSAGPLNSLISFSIFFHSIGFSKYTMVWSVNKYSFTSTMLVPFLLSSFLPFFPSFLPSFSCMSRNSSKILNRSSESRHSLYVPEISKKIFMLLSLIMMLHIVLSWMSLSRLGKMSSIASLPRTFISSGCHFVWCFFLNLLRWSHFLTY